MITIHELPALRFLIFYVIGLFTGAYFLPQTFQWIWVLALFIIGLMITIHYFKKTDHPRNNIICHKVTFLCLLTGMATQWTHSDRFDKDNIRHIEWSEKGQNVEVLGFCEEILPKNKMPKFILKVRAIKLQNDSIWQSKNGRILVFTKDLEPEDLKPGDRIQTKIKIKPVMSPLNPNAFDYKLYLSEKQIYLTAFANAENLKKKGLEPSKLLSHITYSIKLSCIERIKKLIGDNELADLNAGLLLGYRDDIDESTELSFINTGAVHLLAVSGMHVVLIYANLNALLSFRIFGKKLTKKQIDLISIILIWLFSFVVGLVASIVRASIMLSLIILGENFKNQTNPINIVCGGAILMLAFNPNNLYDVGFQLSFAAVFGILTLQKPLDKILPNFPKPIRQIKDLVTITLAAQAGTLPLVLYYFHQFPVYFMLSGVAAVFLSDWIIKIGGLTLLISCLSEQVALIFGKLWYGLSKSLLTSVEWIEALPGGLIDGIYLNEYMLVILIILLICLMIHQFNHLRHIKHIMLFGLCGLIYFDFASLMNSQIQENLTIYSHPKGRIIEIRKGFSSLVLKDTNIDQNQMDYAIKQDQIRARINHNHSIPLQKSYSANLWDEKVNVMIPDLKSVISDSIVMNSLVVLHPDYIIQRKIDARIIQFQKNYRDDQLNERLQKIDLASGYYRIHRALLPDNSDDMSIK